MNYISSQIFRFKNFLFRNSAYHKYQLLSNNDQFLSNKLELLNWIKRKEIVAFVYHNISFYRDYYQKNNFHPDQLVNPSDWNLVPSIDKSQIRDSYNNFVNPAIDSGRHVASNTGGTSGKPLKVLHDKQNFNDVNTWRVMKWWGLPISPNIAFVFRSTRSSKFSILLNRLMWFPTKRFFLDASSVSDDKIKIFLDQIITNHVLVLQGYTGALNEVASYVIKNNINVTGIKAVWCTSSPLTSKIRRNLITAFNADIYDQYGSGEVYWIATECNRHEGLHVHSDIRHVDILDDNDLSVDNGILGNIAVTDLDNYLFPIIKYKNGDLSVIKKDNCSCGKPYPLLEKIYGRVSDLIKLPSGGFIAGDYFTTIFDDYPDDIEGFQVHQKSDFSLDINVKLVKKDNSKFLDAIFDIVQTKTKGDITLRINILDTVQNNLRGKSRFVISDIQ